MNKKGFTLIELLAIIVILAIIAVITVPIILNIIEDASKSSVVDSAYGYKDAIDKFYAYKLLHDKDYVIPSGSYYVDGDNGYLEGTETLDIAVSGKIPSFGKVIIGSGSKVDEMQLCINDYMVSFIDEEMDVVKGCTPVEPGLYDQSNNLVVSYDYLVSEYGFDPSIDVSSGSGTGSILENYSDGAKLILPDTVTKIGDRAFYGNETLTLVIIPPSVTSIGQRAFNYCSSLRNVTFESGSQLTSIGAGAFQYTNLTSVIIPSSVTSIGNNAFGYTKMASITIPPSVTSIEFNAFYGIKAVYYTGSATGSPWGALSVNPYVEGDFAYSDNTKTVLQAYLGSSSSVTIPSGVTSIGDKVFYQNSTLASVTIPSGVTSIGEYAFASTNLMSITIPASVTSIGRSVFSDCSNLASVTFESGSQLISIGRQAFYENKNLTLITLPSSLTSIGEMAFKYANLTSITIPSSVTSIGYDAFYGCSNLASVTFESGSQLTSIGSYAFGFSGLTSITIPSSVTSIENRAFYKVGTVYYSGSASGAPWGADSVVSQ